MENKMKKMKRMKGQNTMRNQTVFVKIKIPFMFFQLILLFQEVYLIQYPPPYIDFLDFMSFFELDIFSVAKMDCPLQIT